MGELVVSPRPAVRHSRAASRLGMKLGNPFDLGDGGPGGWHILDEPELHLGPDVVVPDLAGWRTSTLAELPDEARIATPPDWVCEVLSPSTMARDRSSKREIYAREKVEYLWLLDPVAHTLEIMRLTKEGYLLASVHVGDETVHPVPFHAVPLDLCLLWGTRAPEDDDES